MAPRLALLLLVLLFPVPARAGEGTSGRAKPGEPPGGMPAKAELAATCRQWLRDGTPVEAAWAAWLAAERRLRDLRPDVVARLERDARTKTPFLVDVLLDALIGLEAPVPARVLVPLADRAAVTVLLCHRRTEEPAHLDVFVALDGKGTSAGASWIALGNKLAEWRSPAFVARVFDGYQVQRHVRVFDRKPTEPIFPLPMPAPTPVGRQVTAVPEGFPPVAVWRVARNGGDGYQLLNSGARHVYAKRLLFQPKPKLKLSAPTGTNGTLTRNEIRYAWLWAWLRGARVPSYVPVAQADVVWTGGRQVWQRIREKTYTEAHDGFRAWRDTLSARGLLRGSDVSRLRPHVRVVLEDARLLQRQPLPPLPEPEFDVRLPRSAKSKSAPLGGM